MGVVMGVAHGRERAGREIRLGALFLDKVALRPSGAAMSCGASYYTATTNVE